MKTELKELPMDLAIGMVKEVVKKAKITEGDPIAVTVVDITGTVKASLKMDCALPLASEISRRKAFTAFMTSSDTKKWEDGGEIATDFGDPKDITCFAGGVLLVVGKEIYGGIGVSGRKSFKEKEYDHPQDHELATFGLEYLKKVKKKGEEK